MEHSYSGKRYIEEMAVFVASPPGITTVMRRV